MIRYADKSCEIKLKKMWKDIFGDSTEFINSFFSYRFSENSCFVYEKDGKIVSSLHGYKVKVNINGKYFPAVLVSGVCTLPAYRKKGIMKELFSEYIRRLRKENISFVFYKPENEAFYKSLGHTFISDSLQVQKGNISIKSDVSESIKLSDNISKLKVCYDNFSKRYNGVTDRGSFFKDKIKEYTAENLSAKAILKGGEILSYVVFKEYENHIEVVEAVGENHHIKNILSTFTLPFNAFLPPDFPTENLEGEYKIVPYTMGGIVSVSCLLEVLGSLCPLTFSLTDPVFPENSGVFGFNGLKTKKPADITLSTGQLLKLIFGYDSCYDITSDKKTAAILEKYFPGKPTFTHDIY